MLEQRMRLRSVMSQVALAASGDVPMTRAGADEELHPYTRAILAQQPPQHLLARLRDPLNLPPLCMMFGLQDVLSI